MTMPPKATDTSSPPPPSYDLEMNGGSDVDCNSLKRKRDAESQQLLSCSCSDGTGVGEEERPKEDICNAQHPLWKTSLCSYFRRHSGSCSHGNSCRYAHGEAELRIRPDGSWDPTSLTAKKLSLHACAGKEEEEEQGGDDRKEPTLPSNAVEVQDVLECSDGTTLDKCLIGLPRKWLSKNLSSFLDNLGLLYKTVKKKKGMTVGFITFASLEQLDGALKELNGKTIGGKHMKIADVVNRSNVNKLKGETSFASEVVRPSESNFVKDNSSSSPFLNVGGDGDHPDAILCNSEKGIKTRNARGVVTPLSHMPYGEQLELKKITLSKTLKRLTRNARKACPASIPLPEWIHKSRDIGGLPCELQGIVPSPLMNGYRNKCEFSVGLSLEGKITVGFMLGNFREGMIAVEDPFDCPNVSSISCKYAMLFQVFLQSSSLPIWNRINNTGFWRQLTVREGRTPANFVAEHTETQIAEVMLIVQVCSADVDEEQMKSEFRRLSQCFAHGATACCPALPLSALVVQDHRGISNAAPSDCPLLHLPLPKNETFPNLESQAITEARIHDYICNLRFCISPTAFFQVNTLAAEKLYALAGDWASLSKDTLLFDVCCGTGTIGLTLAHRVGLVVGIEMNNSAVSDALRNADINGIKNCRFICAKAEDVMGSILKEYLDVPKQTGGCIVTFEKPIKNIDCDEAKITRDDEITALVVSVAEQKSNEDGAGSVISDVNDNEIVKKCTSQSQKVTQNDCDSEEKKTESVQQFKNVVAIVDPPRVGLHPLVIKAIRTHPRLRRLVYISCNPESLVANAIELCTPTSDCPEKVKSNRGWRSMSSTGLARHRIKSMPNSEPFHPVRAVAVDLFPHTPHCEMVMLFER